jgi:hypothetical protein
MQAYGLSQKEAATSGAHEINCLPLRLVGCPSFRDVVIYLNQGLSDDDIPSRQLTTRHLPRLCHEVELIIRNRMANHHHFSMTLESWKSTAREIPCCHLPCNQQRLRDRELSARIGPLVRKERQASISPLRSEKYGRTGI